MSTEFWIGLLVSLLVYGVSFGIFYGTVMTKLAAIEKKQDKHNNLVERVFKVEGKQEVHEEQIKVANNRIADLEGVVAK